jgi:hypothetical protein
MKTSINLSLVAAVAVSAPTARHRGRRLCQTTTPTPNCVLAYGLFESDGPLCAAVAHCRGARIRTPATMCSAGTRQIARAICYGL